MLRPAPAICWGSSLPTLGFVVVNVSGGFQSTPGDGVDINIFETQKSSCSQQPSIGVVGIEGTAVVLARASHCFLQPRKQLTFLLKKSDRSLQKLDLVTFQA